MHTINPRYLEVRSLLDPVLAKAARRARIILYVLGCISLVCALVGACMLLFWDDDRNVIGYILGGFGIFLGALTGGMFVLRNPDREIEKVLSVLAYSPELLVWSYIYRVITNGVPATFVVMKFRGNTEYKLTSEVLPHADCEAFIQLLYYINPAMKVGYLDGYKEMYRKNQL